MTWKCDSCGWINERKTLRNRGRELCSHCSSERGKPRNVAYFYEPPKHASKHARPLNRLEDQVQTYADGLPWA